MGGQDRAQLLHTQAAAWRATMIDDDDRLDTHGVAARVRREPLTAWHMVVGQALACTAGLSLTHGLRARPRMCGWSAHAQRFWRWRDLAGEESGAGRAHTSSIQSTLPQPVAVLFWRSREASFDPLELVLASLLSLLVASPSIVTERLPRVGPPRAHHASVAPSLRAKSQKLEPRLAKSKTCERHRKFEEAEKRHTTRLHKVPPVLLIFRDVVPSHRLAVCV